MSPVRFAIRARAEPQTLARLVNYVAQLGFVPRKIRADVAGDTMTLILEQDDLPDQQARIIAEKMSSSVMVEAVEATRDGQPLDFLSEQLR